MTMTRRTIVITGAASGIGAAIARRLAGPGVGLLLHTRQNAANLEQVAQTAQAAGAETALVLGDLADKATVEAIMATAKDRFGGIDQIVSNAGKAKLSSFGEMQDSELDHAFRSMPQAFASLVLGALKDLEQSDWARVVTISSFVTHSHTTAGLTFPATAAAKAALESLTKSLAVELAATGGTANIVVPGFTRKDSTGHAATPNSTYANSTREIPMGRFAEPNDVAAAVTYLLSRDAGHVTGQTLHVNGGLLLR
jgi:3-oxoacyl-[acyl-carrier protein] reductase